MGCALKENSNWKRLFSSSGPLMIFGDVTALPLVISSAKLFLVLQRPRPASYFFSREHFAIYAASLAE